jgi:hypothetical protein
VAAYLRGLGVGKTQLDRMATFREELFRFPVEQRAGVLFGQLMALGLSAEEAACCVEKSPAAALHSTFEPAIAVLADLLASGSKEGQPVAGRQLLGALLRKQPAVANVLQSSGSNLQKTIDHLMELGLSQQQLSAAVRSDWRLLTCDPQTLSALEAVLQQELGADRQLIGKVLLALPQLTRRQCAGRHYRDGQPRTRWKRRVGPKRTEEQLLNMLEWNGGGMIPCRIPSRAVLPA